MSNRHCSRSFADPPNRRRIPVVTTSAGKLVQDWDTLEALDIPLLENALRHIREHGDLPAGLKSKEDLNDAADVDIDEQTIQKLQDSVAQQLQDLLLNACSNAQYSQTSNGPLGISLAFIEGFLLYAPPDDPTHPLRLVHDSIDIPLFLPATYTLLKQRREGRTGYVTIGPAPTPSAPSQGTKTPNEGQQDANSYDPPETNFWTDPPGYVDDIVWPRYITDHAWLLLPESDESNKDLENLKRLIGEGENIRTDAGVIVAPGSGQVPLAQLLHWAVDQVIRGVEDLLARGDEKILRHS